MTSPPRPMVRVRVRAQGAASARSSAGRRKGSRGRGAPVRRSTARRPNARRPAARKRKVGRRRRTGHPTGWWPALLVAVAVLVGVAWSQSQGGPASPALCTLPNSSVTVTEEQVANAAIIAQVGRDRGLPERAVVIALATALQESGLRNLDYGDRDSLGLFQQRPSQGWGTEAQVQDPVYAAGKFYDGLVQVPGWETARLTAAADAVQRSAFPEAYEKHGPLATELAAALAAPDVTVGICP